MPNINTTEYATSMQVRPDDIDLFRHVHSSRYIDYVLAARFEQMQHNYKMSMQEFLQHNLGWVIKSTTIHFKRALTLGDHFVVKTRIINIEKTDVLVAFTIENMRNKLCCDGTFLYTLININTNKAETIPDWVLERFSLPESQ